MKSRQNSVNQIFKPCAFFFFLLIGDTWYFHAIYVVFKYFSSFTGYEDDIFEGTSNLHIQGSKSDGNFDKFGSKYFFNVTPQSSWSLLFPSPGQNGRWCDILAAGEAQ